MSTGTRAREEESIGVRICVWCATFISTDATDVRRIRNRSAGPRPHFVEYGFENTRPTRLKNPHALTLGMALPGKLEKTMSSRLLTMKVVLNMLAIEQERRS